MAQAEGAAEEEVGAGLSVMEKYGLQYVRGCEVVEIRDEGGCTLVSAGTPGLLCACLLPGCRQGLVGLCLTRRGGTAWWCIQRMCGLERQTGAPQPACGQHLGPRPVPAGPQMAS